MCSCCISSSCHVIKSQTVQRNLIIFVQVVRLSFEEGKAAVSDASLRQELETMNGNVQLPQQYLDLARDLDVMEPKLPDDVYKSHLVERTSTSAAVDSARQNMASSFVNGFVNAGFGNDKLVTVDVSEQESQASSRLFTFSCNPYHRLRSFGDSFHAA